ncbi:Carbonic anhydrase [Serratia sp. JKS296]|uniref:carbonic anhydrase n=1 Tax=Serratia sp. JKS296 TaxID=1938824 RepID=UPI000BD034BB|nr:carbonic anhydrase [Serratia sp. JKS296]SOD79447.1 Carbonic anhydrase [Serratia sp. JKS296]
MTHFSSIPDWLGRHDRLHPSNPHGDLSKYHPVSRHQKHLLAGQFVGPGLLVAILADSGNIVVVTFNTLRLLCKIPLIPHTKGCCRMTFLTLNLLLARNRIWSSLLQRDDKAYFQRHQAGQTPRCLWIGCADSRVPAESLVQAQPGELFVLRNVANQVSPEDDNIMSGIEYALTTLAIDTIVICGHTECGGVAYAAQQAALPPSDSGGDTPLKRQLADLINDFRTSPTSQDVPTQTLVERNVRLQLARLRQLPLVQRLMDTHGVTLFGCVYNLTNGQLIALEADTEVGMDENEEPYIKGESA